MRLINSKIYFLLLLGGFFVFSPTLVFAQIVIDPCELNPTDPHCVHEEPEEKQPVIIIPGLAGSHNEKRLTKNQPGDRWAFTPGVGNWFAPLINRLQENGYEVGKNLFVVFYDWRQSNSYSASEFLRPAIQKAKEINNSQKVDIIAHSMGGLVARSYAQGDGYQDDIDQLILLGTPNEGSTGAYIAWEGGDFPLSWDFLSRFWVTRINISLKKNTNNKNLNPPLSYREFFPSLKELLPIKDFVVREGNNLDLSSLKEQNSFLRTLQNTQDRLSDRDIEVITMAGNELSTLQQVRVNHDRTQDDLELQRWRDGHPSSDPPGVDSSEGDGTVMRESAHSLPGVAFTKSSVSHQALPSAFQNEILSQLIEEPSGEFIPAHFASSILGVDIFSPVIPTVVGPHGEILSVSDATFSAETSFEWDEDEPDGTKMLTIVDPPPGQYTVKLQGVDSGPYTIAFSYADEDGMHQEEISGESTQGKTYEYSFEIRGEESFSIHELASSSHQEISGGVGGPSDDSDPDPIIPTTKKKGRVLGSSSSLPACHLLPSIDEIFANVFKRNPTTLERAYWMYRIQVGDKQTAQSLQGAMEWFKKYKKTYDPSVKLLMPVIKNTCKEDDVLTFLFTQTWQRLPTAQEKLHWISRLQKGEKNTVPALFGAIGWQKAH